MTARTAHRWTRWAALAGPATVIASGCFAEPVAPGGSGGGAASGASGSSGRDATSGGAPGAGTSGSAAGSAGKGGTGGASLGGAGAGTGGEIARAGTASMAGSSGTSDAAGAGGSSGSSAQGGSSSGSSGMNGGSAGTPLSGDAGRGGTAGSAGASMAGASGMAGGATSCASSAYPICEDFEDLADGALPAGWTKVGDAATASDMAHRGAKALKLGAATSGARRMRLTGSAVTALGGTHWGRIFYKVQTPAPAPASGVLHSTIVAWDAASPISGTNEIRVVDTVENTEGRHQYLYNVQTSDRGEFGKGSSYDYGYDGAWYCAEWFVDFATQRYRFFLDGEEIESIAVMNGANNFTNSELPSTFTALSVGWNNYQQAPSPGFVAWIDDVAIASERLGCN